MLRKLEEVLAEYTRWAAVLHSVVGLAAQCIEASALAAGSSYLSFEVSVVKDTVHSKEQHRMLACRSLHTAVAEMAGVRMDSA